SSGSGYSDKTFAQHFKKNCTRGSLGLCINWRSRFLADLREKCCSLCFLSAKSFLGLPRSQDGKPVVPSTCLDSHDQREHLIGSTWNTADCLSCECGKDGLHCCHRYGGIADVQGCTSVVNPMTCKYEHYRIDDPSQRCGV
uniref:Beta-microseminoprotein n=1 Tax=Naja naja TaxID=35670 RepID=A0A8C6VQ10_NAJNA